MFLTKLVLTALRVKERVLGSQLFWMAAACVVALGALDLFATHAQAQTYYGVNAPRYYFYLGRWYCY